MKKLIIAQILTLLTVQSAYSESNKSLWGFAGFHFGTASLESDVSSEAGSKEGHQYGLQLSGLYNTDKWAINSSLTWFDLNYDSDYKDGTKVDLKTRTFGAEISPLWKPHHRWYIGPKVAYIIADDILVGPGSGKTTDKLFGLNAFYEIPWKKHKIRSGLHLHQLQDIGDRSSQVFLFSLEVGQLFIQNNKNVDINKNRFAEAPSNTINLSEQTVNFQTGSSQLTKKSRDFLNSLGSVLRDIGNDWDILKIEGHTDLRGPEGFNLQLSKKRVTSVVNALIEGGAPADRISGEAFGETKPINSANTNSAHAKNRRVELRFIGKTNKEKLKTILDELLEK